MSEDEDAEAHDLFMRCLAGCYGEIAPYEPDVQAKKLAIDQQRTLCLQAAQAATQGLQDAFAAGLLTEEQGQRFKDWAAYQLALMTLEQQSGFPEDIAWPSVPDPILALSV